MKYIRTEDGIAQLDDDWALFCKEYAGNKQANTIEELCDEFVCAYLDGFCQIVSFPSEIDVMLGHSVYGAIWTNKGLIYVTKMNNKGELELLNDK